MNKSVNLVHNKYPPTRLLTKKGFKLDSATTNNDARAEVSKYTIYVQFRSTADGSKCKNTSRTPLTPVQKETVYIQAKYHFLSLSVREIAIVVPASDWSVRLSGDGFSSTMLSTSRTLPKGHKLINANVMKVLFLKSTIFNTTEFQKVRLKLFWKFLNKTWKGGQS